MCAELCNNVSRYDGVKYGHRTENYKTIGELYTNSRTEAFGELTKTAVLYGSETLSDDNYMPVYDKSLRVRRVIVEAFASLFEKCPHIHTVLCNGGTAHSLFVKSGYAKGKTVIRMPSTSPAYTMAYEKKLAAWKQAHEGALNT